MKKSLVLFGMLVLCGGFCASAVWAGEKREVFAQRGKVIQSDASGVASVLQNYAGPGQVSVANSGEVVVTFLDEDQNDVVLIVRPEDANSSALVQRRDGVWTIGQQSQKSTRRQAGLLFNTNVENPEELLAIAGTMSLCYRGNTQSATLQISVIVGGGSQFEHTWRLLDNINPLDLSVLTTKQSVSHKDEKAVCSVTCSNGNQASVTCPANMGCTSGCSDGIASAKCGTETLEAGVFNAEPE